MTDTTFWDVEVPTAEHIERALKLAAHCRGFIDRHDIGCVETVYQTDRVIENATDFIADVCEIVGYAPNGQDHDGED